MPTERDDAPPGSFRVPAGHLVLRAVAKGMDIARVAELVPVLRDTTMDWEPVVVSWVGWTWDSRNAGPFEVWRIEDGRHRYFAAVVAGRPDVLCVEQ